MRSRALLLLGCLSAAGACDRSPSPAPSSQTAAVSAAPVASGTVTGAQARKLVTEGAKLVDVRSPAEYGEKHVDGAENIPVDVIADRDLGPKEGAIVLYCHSGRRSARAASALRARGYTRVYDLGGMSSWYD